MNIIIGFDMREKLIKIMTIDKAADKSKGKTAEKTADLKVENSESKKSDKKTDKKAAKKTDRSLAVTTDYLHFNERIFTEQFFAEVNTLLQEHFAQKPLFAGQVAAAIQQTAETYAAEVQTQESVQSPVEETDKVESPSPDGKKSKKKDKKPQKPAKEKKAPKEKGAGGKSLFGGLFSQKASFGIQPVSVVLPNEAIGFETFNLPNMRALKLDQGVETELANEFGVKHKDKKINKFLITHNKQYAMMGAIYYDKGMVNDVFKLLTGFRLFPKTTTYSANAIMDYVYGCAPKTRGKSFIFAEMHKSYTSVVVSSKGKTLGFATIPHGIELLNSERVESEYMRTEHEAGEIAVINAREAAKARALTTAEADLSVIPEDATLADYAVEGAAEGEYSGANSNSLEAIAAKAAVTDGIEVAMEVNEELMGADDALEEAAVADATEAGADTPVSKAEEDKALAEIAKTKLNKVKVYRKMPKRYPKFMQREIPETPEGIIFENFRIIAKWLLLFARQAEMTEYISSPEYILVDMPEDKRFLLDKMNEEQGEEGLKFKPFTAADKLPDQQRSNPELAGCLYAKQFNKNHNF